MLHTDCPPVCADCPPLWTAVDDAEVLLLKAKMAHANTKKEKKEKWYMQMLKRKMVHANAKKKRKEKWYMQIPKKKKNAKHCVENTSVTESVLQSNGLVQHTGLGQRLWVQIPV